MQALWNGKNGANGPNAQPLVVLGQKLGPEDAMNYPLEAVCSVLETQQRLNIAKHLSVQVVPTFAFSFIPNVFLKSFMLIILQPSLRNGKNGASGRNAVPRVAEGRGSGLVHAVNRSLEVISTVMQILQRPGSATCQNVQVFSQRVWGCSCDRIFVFKCFTSHFIVNSCWCLGGVGPMV